MGCIPWWVVLLATLGALTLAFAAFVLIGVWGDRRREARDEYEALVRDVDGIKAKMGLVCEREWCASTSHIGEARKDAYERTAKLAALLGYEWDGAKVTEGRWVKKAAKK